MALAHGPCCIGFSFKTLQYSLCIIVYDSVEFKNKWQQNFPKKYEAVVFVPRRINSFQIR